VKREDPIRVRQFVLDFFLSPQLSLTRENLFYFKRVFSFLEAMTI